MALDFSGASGYKVDWGFISTIQNADPLTLWAWVYPTANATEGMIWNAIQTGGFALSFAHQTDDNLAFVRTRTTSAIYTTNDTPFTTKNKWYFTAVVFNTGASAGEVVNIYVGDLTTLATERTYGTSTDGTGSINTFTAGTFNIGNRASPLDNRNFNGIISACGCLSQALTLGQVQSLQFRPRVAGLSDELFTHLGFNGTGTQPDWSGNGNSGAVTGATVADHAPIFTGFGFDLAALPVAAAGAFTLACDAGTYTVTGQTATLTVDRKVTIDQGSYAITGQAASLLKGFALALDKGSYSVTGQAATLTVDRVLATGQGSYTISGQVTELLVARTIDLAAGAYSVTGQAVTLNKGFTLIADLGSYTLAGQDASLLIARVLALNLGTYTINGLDVTLTYTPIGGFTIALDLGNYAVTGQDAGLIVDRAMALDQGNYAITGQAADLLRGFLVEAEQGSYSVTGNVVNMLIAHLLALSSGAYSFTGLAATLDYSGAAVQTPTNIYYHPARPTAKAASRFTAEADGQSNIKHPQGGER